MRTGFLNPISKRVRRFYIMLAVELGYNKFNYIRDIEVLHHNIYNGCNSICYSMM